MMIKGQKIDSLYLLVPRVKLGTRGKALALLGLLGIFSGCATSDPHSSQNEQYSQKVYGKGNGTLDAFLRGEGGEGREIKEDKVDREDEETIGEMQQKRETPEEDSQEQEPLAPTTLEEVRATYASVLREHMSQFKKCYEKEFPDSASQKNKKSGPLEGGLITLVFSVGGNGEVLRAGIGESELPMSVKACLVEVIWSAKFPPHPMEQIDIDQPIQFY